MAQELPSCERFAEFYTDLLDKRVTVKELPETFIWNRPDAFTAAVYQTQDKKIMGGAICDIGFLSYVGSALTVTPVNTAQYIVDTGVPEEHVFDAFYEVMNITAGLLNDVCATHLALRDCWTDRKKVPMPAKKFLAKPPVIKSYEFTIQDYGSGRLSICRG